MYELITAIINLIIEFIKGAAALYSAYGIVSKDGKPTKKKKSKYLKTYSEIYTPLYKILLSNASNNQIDFKDVAQKCDETITNSVNECPRDIKKFFVKFKSSVNRNENTNVVAGYYNHLFKLVYRNYCIYSHELFAEPLSVKNNSEYEKTIIRTAFNTFAYIMLFLCIVLVYLLMILTIFTSTPLNQKLEMLYNAAFIATLVIYACHSRLYLRERNFRTEIYDKEFDDYYSYHK